MIEKIYICGNPLVDNDSMPFKILKGLKEIFPKISFIEFDPTENFPDEDTVYLLDTVMGISEVREFDDIEQFADAPNLSVHDADLVTHLKMLKKIGKMPKFLIFGVPADGDEQKITKEVANLISKC